MTIINKTWNEADIISHFIDEALGKDASVEDAAQWLNEKLTGDFTITRATVHNWISDKADPGWKYLMAYTVVYPETDLRHQMAKAIIQKRLAEVAPVVADTAVTA